MTDRSNEEQELLDRMERVDTKAQFLKADIAGVNEKIGYVAESAKTFKEGYQEIINRHSTQDDVIASANKMASAMEQQLDDIRKPVDRLSYRIDSTLSIFAATSSSAVTAITSIAPQVLVVRLPPYPFAPDSQTEFYARKLSELDPSLGATYREAWNLIYTLRHDPKRAALFQLRQVFDHLFGKLSPDDDVRRSAFWSKKPGDKPNAVHRDERLSFAAHRCISDEARRSALLESVKETLRSYDRLQEAHKRGALSPDNANEAFTASDSLLRRWIDAADQWPPK